MSTPWLPLTIRGTPAGTWPKVAPLASSAKALRVLASVPVVWARKAAELAGDCSRASSKLVSRSTPCPGRLSTMSCAETAPLLNTTWSDGDTLMLVLAMVLWVSVRTSPSASEL